MEAPRTACLLDVTASQDTRTASWPRRDTATPSTPPSATASHHRFVSTSSVKAQRTKKPTNISKPHTYVVILGNGTPSAPYGRIMTNTHTLRPPRCHWGDIDENLVRLENTVAFHFCLFRRAVWWIWNVANVSLWGGKKDQTWGRMYGCRMMTQIKTEKTIMVDYTVISVHQWLPTGPEDGLTGGKRAFNRHKGWPAHVQCMLGTNSHERESQTPVRHW